MREEYWEGGESWAVFDGDLSLGVSQHWTGEVREYSWSWHCTVTSDGGDSESAVAAGETYRDFLADLEASIFQATVSAATVESAIFQDKVLGRNLKELKESRKAAGQPPFLPLAGRD